MKRLLLFFIEISFCISSCSITQTSSEVFSLFSLDSTSSKESEILDNTNYEHPYKLYPASSFLKIKIDSVWDEEFYEKEHFSEKDNSECSYVLVEATIIKDFYNHLDENYKVLFPVISSYYCRDLPYYEANRIDIFSPIKKLMEEADNSYIYLSNSPKKGNDLNIHLYSRETNTELQTFMPISESIYLPEFHNFLYVQQDILMENILTDCLIKNGYSSNSWVDVYNWENHFPDGATRYEIEKEIETEYQYHLKGH